MTFFVFLFFAPFDPVAAPAPTSADTPATHAPQKGSLISCIFNLPQDFTLHSFEYECKYLHIYPTIFSS
jgi:hypothetical protein